MRHGLDRGCGCFVEGLLLRLKTTEVARMDEHRAEGLASKDCTEIVPRKIAVFLKPNH
jgi:hypothetical protein